MPDVTLLAVAARTVYYAAMSLDGYIAEPEEKLDWLTGFDGPGYAGAGEGDGAGPIETSYPAFMEGVGALVMGSKTYEFILDQEWAYGELPVWVMTSRDLPAVAGAGDLRFASGSVAGLHDEMIDAAGGRDLWVVGGGDLASQYVGAGLLELLRVTVVPTILGDGLPLFAEPVPPMKLLSTTPFDNGMVELSYEIVR
jgi:dihydrofolate reductase